MGQHPRAVRLWEILAHEDDQLELRVFLLGDTWQQDLLEPDKPRVQPGGIIEHRAPLLDAVMGDLKGPL